MNNTSDDVFYDSNEIDIPILDTSESEEEELQDEDTTIEKPKEDISEDSDDSETYTIDSPEYKTYFKKILGYPEYTKHNISSIILENEKVKTFIENIKDYGVNLQIDETHCKNLTEALLRKINPVIHEEFTIIEYTKYKTDDVKSLCELFDGHHRKRAFLDIFKQKPKYKSVIRICLIKSDYPESSQTNMLFRELNTRKPFEIDFTLSDISKLVLSGLNDEFNNSITGFIFIKDKSDSHINRPSIQKHIINNVILSRLDELKKRYNINKNHININVIIKNFIAFNNEISKNKKKLRDDDKSISESMIYKASRNKCFLSLVNLNMLVKKCIGEDYN